MISLKDSEISVPGSRPLVDALRYVLQSMHYGIYVMIGFESHLSFPCVNYLKQLATQPQPDERKLILLGRHLHLPDPLGKLVDAVTFDEPQPVHLRLRDGRWVMS